MPAPQDIHALADARPAALERMLTRLSAIPREACDYTHAADEAEARFGLDAATLAALRSHGLVDDHARYAYCDLHYLGLRLGLAREHLWAVSLWRRSLELVLRAEETRIEVSYLPQLPGEPATVPGRVVLADGQPKDVELRHQETAGKITATLRASWPDVPDEVAAVLNEVAALDFCLLPWRLSCDTALARRIRMTDCSTAAHLVVEGCRELGGRARIAQGLLVGLFVRRARSRCLAVPALTRSTACSRPDRSCTGSPRREQGRADQDDVPDADRRLAS